MLALLMKDQLRILEKNMQKKYQILGILSDQQEWDILSRIHTFDQEKFGKPDIHKQERK